MSDLSFKLSWLPPGVGSVEVKETSALLKITVGDQVATMIDDQWSHSVQSYTRVSAYPLALWIASSWWRLRWETAPPNHQIPDAGWRMAHDVAAAGYGFIWPSLTFEGGEMISIVCRPSEPSPAEPIRYLSSFRRTIDAATFERAIDHFMSLVLARLQARGVDAGDLAGLWNEILHERKDPILACLRKIEAQLGYDPDDAPEGLPERFHQLASTAGPEAANEITVACAGAAPQRNLDEILALSHANGPVGQFQLSGEDFALERGSNRPWIAGWELAKTVRNNLKHSNGPLSGETISNLLGITGNALMSAAAGPRRPVGLACQEPSGRMKFLFHKPNPAARRFEAARFLADHLVSTLKNTWIAVTGTDTSRQKLQRAFATEFLCPIEDLRAYLASDYSEEAIEDAASHFGISDKAINHQLINHGLLSAEAYTY